MDLSWVVHKSDTKRFHFTCKVRSCKFKVRVVFSKQFNDITLRQYIEHGLNLDKHFNFRGKKVVKLLKDKHRATITADRNIQSGK